MFWVNQIEVFFKCNTYEKIEGSAWFLFVDKHKGFLKVSDIAFGGVTRCPQSFEEEMRDD